MYIYRVLMDRESDNMGSVPSLYGPPREREMLQGGTRLT
jgi:hypothetical protein